jgi:hypothetical protein
VLQTEGWTQPINFCPSKESKIYNDMRASDINNWEKDTIKLGMSEV